jgi:hypothetical protein
MPKMTVTRAYTLAMKDYDAPAISRTPPGEAPQQRAERLFADQRAITSWLAENPRLPNATVGDASRMILRLMDQAAKAPRARSPGATRTPKPSTGNPRGRPPNERTAAARAALPRLIATARTRGEAYLSTQLRQQDAATLRTIIKANNLDPTRFTKSERSTFMLADFIAARMAQRANG